jgi:hypothetical protein
MTFKIPHFPFFMGNGEFYFRIFIPAGQIPLNECVKIPHFPFFMGNGELFEVNFLMDFSAVPYVKELFCNMDFKWSRDKLI